VPEQANRVNPSGVVYSATKYAVRAVSEGLRLETTDIRVTVVSPGLTQTELTHAGGNPELQSAMREAATAVGIDP
jgi:NADP-dependent 3-hydroxy acid dehydrogenase YdfG